MWSYVFNYNSARLLSDVLKFHIVPGGRRLSDFKDGEKLYTLNGNPLTVTRNTTGKCFSILIKIFQVLMHCCRQTKRQRKLTYTDQIRGFSCRVQNILLCDFIIWLADKHVCEADR